MFSCSAEAVDCKLSMKFEKIALHKKWMWHVQHTRQRYLSDYIKNVMYCMNTGKGTLCLCSALNGCHGTHPGVLRLVFLQSELIGIKMRWNIASIKYTLYAKLIFDAFKFALNPYILHIELTRNVEGLDHLCKLRSKSLNPISRIN